MYHWPICRKSLAITLPKNGKSPLPVDLRRSKTSLLELLMKGLSDGFLLPSQLRTHGRGPRGRPHYFQTKLKKIFGDRPPPPPLSRFWATIDSAVPFTGTDPGIFDWGGRGSKLWTVELFCGKLLLIEKITCFSIWTPVTFGAGNTAFRTETNRS